MELPKNYHYYYQTKYIIRTKFKTKEEVDKWIHELKESSKISWVTMKSIVIPEGKSKYHIFRGEYYCPVKTTPHNLSESKNSGPSPAVINCPAELSIIIKSALPSAQTKSRVTDILVEDWPCVLQFKNCHNHSMDNDTLMSRSNESFSSERSSKSVCRRSVKDKGKLRKEKLSTRAESEILTENQLEHEISSYSTRGHSASTGYISFCFKHVESLYNFDDLSIFPSRNHFHGAWRRLSNQEYTDERSTYEKIEEALKRTKGTLYKINLIDHNSTYAVALCTRTMQRAVRCLSLDKIYFVTKSGHTQNSRLSFIAAESPAGLMPLGCIIVNFPTQEILCKVLQSLVEILPIPFSPSVIITNDMGTVDETFKKIWPNATTLLCISQILKNTWDWLTNVNDLSFINDEMRMVLYRHFRYTLMSKSKEDVERNIQIFNLACSHPDYKKNANAVLSRMHSLFTKYKENIELYASYVNEYIQVIFKMFMIQVSSEKTKLYDLVQLVDFVVTDFNDYYKKRILDLVSGKLNKAAITRLLLPEDVAFYNKVTKLASLQYFVETSTDDRKVYFVDMFSRICSCVPGLADYTCLHQLAAISNSDLKDACNTVSEDDKKTLFKIATGKEYLFQRERNENIDTLANFQCGSTTNLADAEIDDALEEDEIEIVKHELAYDYEESETDTDNEISTYSQNQETNNSMSCPCDDTAEEGDIKIVKHEIIYEDVSNRTDITKDNIFSETDNRAIDADKVFHPVDEEFSNDTQILYETKHGKLGTKNEDEDSACSQSRAIDNMEFEMNTIEKWNVFIKKFSNDITRCIADDPRSFSPAVDSFIDRYNEMVTDPSTLLSVLRNSCK